MLNNELQHILLVEDDEDIQTIAQIALEKIGKFNVVYCSSGLDALIQATASPPDLILLDMMMPGMDGIATLRALRQSSRLKDIPIIFMTAKVQKNEIHEYLELGALHVIAKPFDPMTLADTLRTLWKKYQTNKGKNVTITDSL